MTTERRDDDGAERINRQSPMPASAMDSLAGIGLFARCSDWREAENLPTAKEIGGGRRRAHPAFPDLFLFFTRPRFLILHVGFTITSFSDEDEKIPTFTQRT